MRTAPKLKRRKPSPPPSEKLLDNTVTLYPGDMLKVLPTLRADSIDSVVTDPPYHLTSVVKRFGNARSNLQRDPDTLQDWGRNSPYHRPAGSAGYVPTFKYGTWCDRDDRGGVGGAMYRLSRGFMGKHWDGGDIAFRVETWREVYRVLKPGGHVVAFGGTRTFGRMQVAMEEAGFEIRDTIMWLYGSGFPKSHDVSKHIDAKLQHGKTSTRQLRKVNETRPGAGKKGGRLPNAGIMSGNLREAAVSRDQPITKQAKQWQGWGTALKPACEPIVLARKPLDGTIATNVLKHGTGALNIDACRIDTKPLGDSGGRVRRTSTGGMQHKATPIYNQFKPKAEREDLLTSKGRWPANVVHDGSKEVIKGFPDNQHPRSRLVKASLSRGRALSGSVDGSLRNEFYYDASKGRWPANVITDGSDEVTKEFPESQSTRAEITSTPGQVYGGGKGLPSHTGEYGFDDEGSVSRFFYQVKADPYEEVVITWISESEPCQAVLRVAMGQSLAKATVVSVSGDANGWNTFLSGSTITELFQKASMSIIRTATKSTTKSKIWNYLTSSLTSACTAGVKYETENGGSRAENADNYCGSIIITLAKTASLPGANSAASKTRLKISVSVRQVEGGLNARLWYGAKADGDDRIGAVHPTVKPMDLMRYLVRLVTPPGGVVLDPFAGTGTTGEAVWWENKNNALVTAGQQPPMHAVLIEMEPEYQADIRLRMDTAPDWGWGREVDVKRHKSVVPGKDYCKWFNYDD